MSENHGVHHTVLLREAVAAMNVRADGIYMDGTFGRGGHSRLLLDHLGAEGRLFALDKDPAAIAHARHQFAEDPRFHIDQGSFSDLDEVARRHQIFGQVDGLLLDLGVSSPQLDDAQRGFSFQHDGPLDMRMNPEAGRSAAQWLSTAEADEISGVLKDYGEERFSRRIANAIVERRRNRPIVTTLELSDLIRHAVPKTEKHKHPATRSFQAIRIFINSELDDLRQVLGKALDFLATGARLVVISFHSLEDRIVKRFMRDAARGEQFPPGLPVTEAQIKGGRLRLLGKPVRPGAEEIAANPRARSAIMRVAEVLA